MRTNKSCIAVLLAVVLLLTACGGSTDTVPNTENINTPSVDTNAPSEDEHAPEENLPQEESEQVIEPEPVVAYSPVLNKYNIPEGLGKPQHSEDEIREMIENNLTLDQVAEKISTLADLIQYLYLKDYGKVVVSVGDLSFKWGGYEWSVNRSAQTVFEENYGNCGGGSNLVNYILRGDYDSQGYVGESANGGGHIYNYFEEDGVYYFFDLTQVVGPANNYFQNPYEIFATTSPQEFSDHYIGKNHEYTSLENGNGPYLLLQFMYEYEGDHLPKGWKNEFTYGDYWYANILPIEYQSATTVLYVEEGFAAPVFVESPPHDVWPVVEPSHIPIIEQQENESEDDNPENLGRTTRFQYDLDGDGEKEDYIFGLKPVNLEENKFFGMMRMPYQPADGFQNSLIPCVLKKTDDGADRAPSSSRKSIAVHGWQKPVPCSMDNFSLRRSRISFTNKKSNKLKTPDRLCPVFWSIFSLPQW